MKTTFYPMKLCYATGAISGKNALPKWGRIQSNGLIECYLSIRLCSITNAGMSAESGIPTYREAEGIWKKYNFDKYTCEKVSQRDP